MLRHDRAGIAEVPDPSALFLGHGSPEPGTCVAIALEGRRALPVEVQALTIKTTAPNPRRIVNGVDAARVAMVLAVLEKKAGVVTSDQDVYVSTVGGVRFTEPAADLAIAIAVAGAAAQRGDPEDAGRGRRAEPRRRGAAGDAVAAAAQRGGPARLHRPHRQSLGHAPRRAERRARPGPACGRETTSPSSDGTAW